MKDVDHITSKIKRDSKDKLKNELMLSERISNFDILKLVLFLNFEIPLLGNEEKKRSLLISVLHFYIGIDY